MTTRREFLAGAAGLGVTVAIAHRITPAVAKARFNVSNGLFVLDGQPFQVLAGEMHYPRIPRELWRDRMQKLKSLGLNTLTTYVFWNAHEPQPGHFEFSGNLDVAAYIRMAQEEGLWVNLRPGPYAQALHEAGQKLAQAVGPGVGAAVDIEWRSDHPDTGRKRIRLLRVGPRLYASEP
jgi:beta-galactosidase